MCRLVRDGAAKGGEREQLRRSRSLAARSPPMCPEPRSSNPWSSTTPDIRGVWESKRTGNITGGACARRATKEKGMKRQTLYPISRLLAAVAASTDFAACAADESLGPNRGLALSREADLGSCQNLQVPAESKLVSRMYAEGDQIYRWNGTSWAFVAPSALLFANADGTGLVGTHYAGPTWESNSGSKVVARVLDRCTPDASAIPWLKLEAVSSEGPGI